MLFTGTWVETERIEAEPDAVGTAVGAVVITGATVLTDVALTGTMVTAGTAVAELMFTGTWVEIERIVGEPEDAGTAAVGTAVITGAA